MLFRFPLRLVRCTVVGLFGDFRDCGMVWFRSVVASCVCKLAESKKGFLVQVLPYSTFLYGLFHCSVDEHVQSFGLGGDQGRMDRKFLFISANKELEVA